MNAKRFQMNFNTLGIMTLLFSLLMMLLSILGGLAYSELNWISGNFTAGGIWGYCPINANAYMPNPRNNSEVLQLPICVTIFTPKSIESAHEMAKELQLGTPNAEWDLYRAAFAMHFMAFLMAIAAVALHIKNRVFANVFVTGISGLFSSIGFIIGIVLSLASIDAINNETSYDVEGKMGPGVALSLLASLSLFSSFLFYLKHDRITKKRDIEAVYKSPNEAESTHRDLSPEKV